jgi:hypothetical protein
VLVSGSCRPNLEKSPTRNRRRRKKKKKKKKKKKRREESVNSDRVFSFLLPFPCF